ncbi:acyltransferase family protein [Sphingomonas sp. HT-1]|uniref:acyltransferase family protein n=1 Tax=unclassified Sphingomonas TaxID=196159 RepID=UPI00036AA61E|nr:MULTISPECIES: acyltransferase [unclassified Sphingomonas]KTF70680.1 hypothetical protein ATB93_18680 [Sphingomonas sp. WG]
MVKTDRVQEIDGLRAVAAIMVMFAHWFEAISRQQVPPAVQAISHALLGEYFSPGRMAVVAFFCISGYVIPFSFKGSNPLVSFPISRIFRLYPAFWAAVTAGAIVGIATGSDPITLPRFLLNLTMLHMFLGTKSIIGVDWTLVIEWLFYGICYAMFVASLLSRPLFHYAMMVCFIGAASALGAWRWLHPASGLPVGIPTYLAAMHFGTLARMYMSGDGRVSRSFFHVSLATLTGGVLAAYFLAYWRASNEQLGYIASNAGYFAGVGIFLACIRFQLFGGSFLASIGRISYSIYLLHTTVIVALISVWKMIPDWSLASLVMTPIYIATVFMAASVSYKYVELPFQERGKHVRRRLEDAIARRRGHRAERV